ncbi:MAG: MipA/OmpV family protein [Desulfobacterales bacterium]|nr:MipA/OmpV family protein [Desulfobacterales bacterium]MCP4158618.1 MipA/OmpV family protein [Deltaproteobacteria bacterium]
MTRNLIMILIVGLFTIVLVENSFAQSKYKKGKERVENKRKERDEDFIKIGVMGIYKPNYEGSDDYNEIGFPIIEIKYDRYFFNIDGLGMFLWKGKFVELTTAVGYEAGRNEDDSTDLNGLGDVEDGAKGNVGLKIKLGLLSLNAGYEKQFTGENTGYQCNYGLGLMLPLSKAFIIVTGVKATYASDKYMEKYFSVNSTQSSQSGLAVYTAEAGFKSVGANIVGILNLSKNWGIQIIGNYTRLVSDAADSPIVKDKDQYFSAIGLSYKF